MEINPKFRLLSASLSLTGMQAAASAAARAAVAALQQAGAGQPCAAAIAALLPAAHCSIALDCNSVNNSTRLASGNLLGQSWGTALLAGPSLAALCIKERKAKVLKSLQAARCANPAIGHTGQGLPPPLPLVPPSIPCAAMHIHRSHP